MNFSTEICSTWIFFVGGYRRTLLLLSRLRFIETQAELKKKKNKNRESWKIEELSSAINFLKNSKYTVEMENFAC